MARTKAKEHEVTITEGSGNVFADIGLPNPEEMLAKAELVFAISRIMRQKNMTQARLAKLIEMDQPSVSLLLRGRTRGYSIERLSRILNLLGQDVEIKVTPKPKGASRSGRTVVGVSTVAEKKRPYAAKKAAPKKRASKPKAAAR